MNISLISTKSDNIQNLLKFNPKKIGNNLYTAKLTEQEIDECRGFAEVDSIIN